MILNFEVEQFADYVFACLSDHTKFVKVHPVITSIQDRGNGNFTIYETLRVAGIPVSFTYPARIFSYKEQQKVIMKARVMKVVRIEMMFEIKTISARRCSVSENVSFKSFLPVHFIMQGVFRKQHSLLFQNIGQVMI